MTTQVVIGIFKSNANTKVTIEHFVAPNDESKPEWVEAEEQNFDKDHGGVMQTFIHGTRRVVIEET
jgi:MOSC domain-containing protein YiiM